MFFLLLIIGCLSKEDAVADFAFEKCQLISDCELLGSYSFKDIEQCRQFEVERAISLKYLPELAEECTFELKRQQCSDYAQAGEPAACSAWLEN